MATRKHCCLCWYIHIPMIHKQTPLLLHSEKTQNWLTQKHALCTCFFYLNCAFVRPCYKKKIWRRHFSLIFLKTGMFINKENIKKISFGEGGLAMQKACHLFFKNLKNREGEGCLYIGGISHICRTMLSMLVHIWIGHLCVTCYSMVIILHGWISWSLCCTFIGSMCHIMGIVCASIGVIVHVAVLLEAIYVISWSLFCACVAPRH